MQDSWLFLERSRPRATELWYFKTKCPTRNQQPQEHARSIPLFNPHKIVRDETSKRIRTQTEIKRYQLVADKRVVDSEDYGSFPYGFAPAPLNHSSDDDDVFEL